MKKSKDVLGDVFKGIIIVSLIVCIFGSIFVGFGTGHIDLGLIFIGVALACLFMYWLISAISKITVSLKEISENSSIIRSCCESKMNENTIPPIPEPTNTEIKE